MQNMLISGTPGFLQPLPPSITDDWPKSFHHRHLVLAHLVDVVHIVKESAFATWVLQIE